jgi:hypothetical protein
MSFSWHVVMLNVIFLKVVMMSVLASSRKLYSIKDRIRSCISQTLYIYLYIYISMDTDVLHRCLWTQIFYIDVYGGSFTLHKVAGVKVYPRQTWNFRSHAVTACSNHVVSLWRHRPMHAPQANCMHCPMTSQADACRYCMGSKGSSLSQICLYFSYITYSQKITKVGVYQMSAVYYYLSCRWNIKKW